MKHDDIVIDSNEKLWKYNPGTDTYTRITGDGLGQEYCTDVSPDDLIRYRGPLGIPGRESLMPVYDRDGDAWHYSEDAMNWVCAKDNSEVDTLDEIQELYKPLTLRPPTPKPEGTKQIAAGMFIKPKHAVFRVTYVFDDNTAEVRDVSNDDVHHVLLENYEETDAPLPGIGDVYVQKGVNGARGLAFIVKEHVGNRTVTLSNGGMELTLDAEELSNTGVWTRIH